MSTRSKTGRRVALGICLVMAGAVLTRPPRRPGTAESSSSTAQLERSCDEVREELGRANSAALGVAGVVATIVITGIAALLAGDWTAGQLPPVGQVGWWAGVTASLVGLVLLAAVLFPKAPRETVRRPEPSYWGQIAAYDEDDLAALAVALDRLSHDPLARVANLRRMSVGARTKWRRVRRALVALAVAGVLLVLTALTSVAT